MCPPVQEIKLEETGSGTKNAGEPAQHPMVKTLSFISNDV